MTPDAALTQGRGRSQWQDHCGPKQSFLPSCAQVANGGGLEALALDAAGRALSGSYARRVATHEAGHFLLAYLVGLLPRSYTLSSLDALRRCARAAGARRQLGAFTHTDRQRCRLLTLCLAPALVMPSGTCYASCGRY